MNKQQNKQVIHDCWVTTDVVPGTSTGKCECGWKSGVFYTITSAERECLKHVIDNGGAEK